MNSGILCNLRLLWPCQRKVPPTFHDLVPLVDDIVKASVVGVADDPVSMYTANITIELAISVSNSVWPDLTKLLEFA